MTGEGIRGGGGEGVKGEGGSGVGLVSLGHFTHNFSPSYNSTTLLYRMGM